MHFANAKVDVLLHPLTMPDATVDNLAPIAVPLFAERSVDASGSDETGGSTLEWVLRSLLRVRGEDEAQRTVVDLFRAATTARWAALYVHEEGEFRLRRCSPESHQPIGGAFAGGALDGLPAGRRLPAVCPADSPLRGTVSQDLTLIAPIALAEGAEAVVLVGPPVRGSARSDASLGQVHRVAEACSIALQNAQLVESLRSQVYVDYLTGCHNRRGFEERIRVEIGRARRYERPVSLLLVDIDHFKWINDSMGHPTGDYALRRLGEFLRESFRTTDCVCRFGGDEFAIIFPETPKHEASRLAEELRVKLTALFPDEVMRRGITASLGVASMPADAEGEEQLVAAADRALYRAKGTGRNRVVT